MRRLGSFTCFVFVIAFCGSLCLVPPAGSQSQSGPAPDDETVSRLLTRTFQRDLLPNLKNGIPELGILSIDPITLPKFSIINIDLGLFKCATTVNNFVLYGLGNISESDIRIDTGSRVITARFHFPRAGGKSTGTRTACYVLGRALWSPEGGGLLEYRMDGLLITGKFKLRPTEAEIVRLVDVDLQLKGFTGRGTGTVPVAVETVTNWLLKHYGLYFFKYLMQDGLSEATRQIFGMFMDANAWQAVLGDIV